MSYRRPEKHHDLVANVLIDVTVVPLYHLGDGLEKCVEQGAYLFWVELFGQRSESAEVGEEDRDLLALIH